MRIKGLIWGLVLVIPLWVVIMWALVGCAPTSGVRYEDDPGHYPYYKPAQDHSGEVGFVPKGNGVIIGGPRDGGVVHNDKIYNTDGSLEFRR